MKRRRFLLAVPGAIALLALVGILAARDGRMSARAYAPPADVPRLAAETLHVADVGGVLDFDWYGEELYLLDPLEHAVTVLRERSGSWDRVRRFGRYGGGPGELLRPTGIARLRDPARIAVVDQARLHLFDTAGAYLESLPVDVPCVLPLPRVAAGMHGVYVHGDCMQRSPAGDTVYAVLFWSADGTEYREVARDPRYTPDGRFGSIFGARMAFTPGAGHHLFGSGINDCLWRVREAPEPVVQRACGVQQERFPLVLERATAEALARRPLGPAARIPDAHAWYEERVPGAMDLLMRGFHEDSLVLRAARTAGDLAVLPNLGLKGCRSGGCLYAEPLEQGVRIGLIPASTLQARAAGGLE